MSPSYVTWYNFNVYQPSMLIKETKDLQGYLLFNPLYFWHNYLGSKRDKTETRNVFIYRTLVCNSYVSHECELTSLNLYVTICLSVSNDSMLPIFFPRFTQQASIIVFLEKIQWESQYITIMANPFWQGNLLRYLSHWSSKTFQLKSTKVLRQVKHEHAVTSNV